jgi:hypothetical protein
MDGMKAMHDFALCAAYMRWNHAHRHAGVACTPPHAMGSGTAPPPVYGENKRRWKEDVACVVVATVGPYHQVLEKPRLGVP